MNQEDRAFTYLLSGPTLSRSNIKDTVSHLNEMNDSIRGLNKENSLVIVTYEYERNREWRNLSKEVKLLFVPDPGADSMTPVKGRTRTEVNLTRMYRTTLKGLSIADGYWTVKTRIELLPAVGKIDLHIEYLTECINRMVEMNNKCTMAFIHGHYNGPSSPRKGVILWIPDTLQVMRTKEAQILWEEAHRFWLMYKTTDFFNKKTFLASEQIIGASYFSEFFGFDKSDVSTRDYFSYLGFKQNYVAEQKLFLFMDFKKLSVTESKFEKRLSESEVYLKKPLIDSYYGKLFEIIFRRFFTRFAPAFLYYIDSLRLKIRRAIKRSTEEE